MNITENLIKQTVSHLAKDGGYTENRVRIVLTNAQYIEGSMGIDTCANDVKVAENMLSLSNIKADSWLVQKRIQAILSAAKKYACTTTPEEKPDAPPDAPPSNAAAFFEQYKIPLIVAGVSITALTVMYFNGKKKVVKRRRKSKNE
ncbi:MAG: hypothetical protein LBO69_06150 [Ignavibacteria bacterium]|jgi:hypothetical protein|nr:hypothetical protein [Ignavibacteria bacterium]